MWFIPAFVFALVALGLAFRLRSVSNMLRDLADSAQQREPMLIERRSRFGVGKQVESLHDALNTLISEAKYGRNRDRDYLHQIETTLGSIREVILIVDDSHYVRMANDAARQLIGTNKHLLGRRVESLLPSVGFLDYVRGTWNGSKSGNEVVEIVTGEEHMWFEVTGALISSDESRQRLSLFVLHDITKLKLLESMRTEFVANVSHELRTPVTVIRGFTDTLLEEGEDLDAAARERFLRKIERNVVRLNTLLEDLLTLSRMEGRESVLKPELISLNDLVREICENYSDRKPADCELDFQLDLGIPLMPLDPLRITQVLENLMDNAVRHARGMTTLRIRTAMKGNIVVCAVEDNGCGIPAPDIPHIFERFYRVDKGRSRESGGTGLGLSIVKHIILQHGGNVFVHSRTGHGTSMGFEIPKAPEDLAE